MRGLFEVFRIDNLNEQCIIPDIVVAADEKDARVKAIERAGMSHWENLDDRYFFIVRRVGDVGE